MASPPGAELEREVKNIPNQMGAAKLINGAQARLHARGAPIVLQHHDSLMLEVPEADVPYWSDILREEMERPVEGLGGVVFPVDLMVGRNWAEASPENPAGLRKAEV